MRESISTLGAIVSPVGTTFRVWAPEHERVELVVEGHAGEPDIRSLTKDQCGYWSGTFSDIVPGARYRYRLEGDEGRTFPDPASRFQPCGVHGPSQVIDPSAFRWTDAAWQPPPLEAVVFYELHVGTFTPEGTFRGAIDRLPYLKDLGVNAIELMPVGDFPGTRNWGYDGVALFAPARCYGTPDDLRALVDAAHAHGIAVCLDVVYNHLGPDGAYAYAFSPYYFSSRHSSPWGLGVNVDGPHNEQVRRFFIENAVHWVREYHIDALRLDATHAIQDDSERHFLAELSSTVRAHNDRPVILVAEDHRNLDTLLLPPENGGFGLDAVWADDFHHQARVHTAGDREGYYRDFSGTTADLATTLQQGWFFTGQYSPHLAEDRGTSPAPLAPHQFVICIQNHDQIGNRADGARLHHQIDPAAYRALSVLLLLAPETPLLFMGQEWAASAPFLFFTDHHDELGRKVTEGRRKEFSAFAAFHDPRHRELIPDPQDAGTFDRSRLCWSECERPPHAGVLGLYRRLLKLRRSLPPAPRHTFGARELDPSTVLLRRYSLDEPHGVAVVARISGGSGEVVVANNGTAPRVVLTTEDADLFPDSTPVTIEAGANAVKLRFVRPGAVVLGSPLAS
jgi:maltooligosyltrehalose trehalohydrolase